MTVIYEFTVKAEINRQSPTPYRLNIIYSGDPQFFDWLLTAAEEDGVVFTRRSLSWPLRILHQCDHLYYLEKPSMKGSKHTQWRLSDLLTDGTEVLLFEKEHDAYEAQKTLESVLNLFAKEEAGKFQSKK